MQPPSRWFGLLLDRHRIRMALHLRCSSGVPCPVALCNDSLFGLVDGIESVSPLFFAVFNLGEVVSECIEVGEGDPKRDAKNRPLSVQPQPRWSVRVRPKDALFLPTFFVVVFVRCFATVAKVLSLLLFLRYFPDTFDARDTIIHE